jgi:AcrR family transcriptional regulator
VIDAAIVTILERGFRRASSNEIAHRAGLTWGVIQYHFGTREALMLAVLDEGSRRLRILLESAHIEGATLQERLGEYLDIIAAYYSAPDYLAFLQVLLNLSHDPATSAETVRSLEDLARSANPDFDRLIAEVLGPGSHDAALEGLLFVSFRGIALSELLFSRVPKRERPDPRSQKLRARRRLLVRALAQLVEGADSRGTPGR